MSLSEKQRGVARNAAIAGAVTLILIPAAIHFGPAVLGPIETLRDLLDVWAICSLPPVLWLLASIGSIAQYRFLHAEDIDGSGLTEGSPRVMILRAVLQNTLEQAVLAVLVYAGFLLLAPPGWAGGVAMATILFAIGRLLFRHGYMSGAPGRALGFGLTFYPTVLLVLILTGSLLVDVLT